MRKPLVDISVFKKRRAELAKKIEGSALILLANRETPRNYDVNNEFRQDSNFFYLTGFEEPDAVFVFRPGQTPETTMFVRPKDRLAEVWQGFRFGVDGVKSSYDIDQSFEVSEISEKLPDLLKTCDKIYYRVGQNDFDSKLQKALDTVRLSFGRSGRGLLPVLDYWELLGELRVRKSPQEIEWMKAAGKLSALAHTNAMKFTKPGVTERQVQAVIEYTFKMGGAARPGYGSIVAAGSNATCLHYVFNDQKCNAGDLFLIDAGCEWNYYGADITRTFPISKKFSGPQKDLYEGVLKVQKQMVSEAIVGSNFTKQQEKATGLLADVLLDLKVTKHTKSELLEDKHIKKYYPHGLGHYLGMDVHDLGLYVKGNEPRPFEAGMVLTIEPGLYIPEDDTYADEKFRGIGIRIEDDVHITATGNEVLTSDVTKEVSEIESIVGTGWNPAAI